jgi:uncharacterized OB-fold protein
MGGFIPKPTLDSDSKPFWEGLLKKELWIQQCNDCHQHIYYPRSICPHCFSEEINWVQSEGTGKIYSYTVVHRAIGGFKEQVPFVVAIVELDEGVRMMTRIKEDSRPLKIDEKVKIFYEKIDEELTLPYFELI